MSVAVDTRARATSPATRRQGWLAVITSGFPRRSETFLLNELLALDRRGALAAVFATRPGDDAGPQPGVQTLARLVQTLPPGTADEQAAVAAGQLQGLGLAGVHGYFAHAPAAVAAATARVLGVPYGFSVHARDARKVAPAELGARARAAACVLACNVDAAQEVRRAGGQATLVPHGVDLGRFHRRPPPAEGELAVLAVGRLVEKKGFDVLVEAFRRLDVPARLRIVGAGPEQPRLRRAIASMGLERTVELCGPLTHAQLPREYAAADLVVAPSVTDSSGDRDGLPNVVLEAMASGRPVVASDVGALSTGVIDGQTGLLVPAGDTAALRAAIRALWAAPERREAMGRAARRVAEERFDAERCCARLHAVLEAAYA